MKKAIRCMAFLIILFFSITGTYNVLSWKDTHGDYITSTKQLYSTDENLMDVIFLGSSHCYCGINPDVLWGNYGISAFNMTISGQDKDSTYHTLVETLKTQSPEIVCVEMWGLTFDEHAVLGNAYRNMMAMKLSRNSIELIEDYVDENEQMDYILRWPIVHTRYKEIDKYDFITHDYSIYGRGYPNGYNLATWAGYPSEAMALTEKVALSDSNREWLEELYQLSVEEGFELIFFVAPSGISNEGQLQVNAAQEFAEERDITFFDFNRMIGNGEFSVDYRQDFTDNFHLNTWGSEKLTTYFGNLFEQNYALVDHRGEGEYHQWDDSYTYYEQMKAAYYLENVASLEDYITQLKQMRNITYLISFEGLYQESALDFEKEMSRFGITSQQYMEGGTYVCANGTIQKLWDKDSEEAAIYELNKYDAFKVQNMSLVDPNATNLDNIMFNMESVGAVYNGVSFIVYDDIRKELISKRGFY